MNRNKNAFHKLQLKFKGIYVANYRKYHKSKLFKIVIAINVIEIENRTMAWRFFEYLYLLVNIMFYGITKKIKNISIGTYQIKIQHILDFIKVQYRIQNKDIYPYGFELKMFLKLFLLGSNFYVIESLLINKFSNYKWQSLTEPELKNIALFYSGNIIFKGCVNYYTVLKTLYFCE